MELTNYVESIETADVLVDNDGIIVDASKVPNSVLQRLMAEVKNDSVNQMFAYDRAHNRHNRGR